MAPLSRRKIPLFAKDMNDAENALDSTFYDFPAVFFSPIDNPTMTVHWGLPQGQARLSS